MRVPTVMSTTVQTDPTSDYPKPRKKQVVSLKRNTWSPSPTAHVGSDGWLTVHWLPPFGRVESESMVRFYSLMWRFGDQGDWCGTFQSMSLQQPSASFDLRDNTKLFEVSFRYAYVLHDDRASSWSMVSPAVTVCARCPHAWAAASFRVGIAMRRPGWEEGWDRVGAPVRMRVLLIL